MRKAKTTNVTIRIDEQLKKDAESLFASLGLNVSNAFTLFLRQCITEQGIPFPITLRARQNVSTDHSSRPLITSTSESECNHESN